MEKRKSSCENLGAFSNADLSFAARAARWTGRRVGLGLSCLRFGLTSGRTLLRRRRSGCGKALLSCSARLAGRGDGRGRDRVNYLEFPAIPTKFRENVGVT